MKETARMTELFEKLYDGESWVGENLTGTLAKISPEKAARKLAPWNSIWEIVHHIIQWRQNVLRRVQGETVATPPENYFKPVTDQSAEGWTSTLADLGRSQQDWVAFLQTMDEASLELIYPGNNDSYYHNIHGILQHDAYHLGQIILLMKV